MRVGNTAHPKGAAQKTSASKITRGFFAAIIASGCGSLIGIDDTPPASECVRDTDCATGLACIEFRCVSAVGGEGGEAGMARGGTGGQGGTAGSGATGGAGEAGDGNGTAGKAPFAMGGNAGSSGHGGAAGHAGDEGGAGGEPPSDMGGAGAGGQPVVNECEGSECRECNEEGRVIPGTQCNAACTDDERCFTPPSCDGITSRCGSNQSCCLAYPVYGGTFERSCETAEGPSPATIATFALDAFEVTVGRFQIFINKYATAQPATGAGKNPNNPSDPGWLAEWNEFLPATREDVVEQLNLDCGEALTLNQSNESLPMNCVSWHLANAFCIWDGGRLPTDAEWDYAASGGNEQRYFPWSDPPSSTLIDETYAVYEEGDTPPDRPETAGAHRPGRGRWLQYDLGGNVWEWVFDDHSACYPTDSCDNCGSASAALVQKAARGGSFFSPISTVHVAGARNNTNGTSPDFGFRCARNL